MQAGNAIYETIADLPPVLPVFPLSGALLLPRTQLPLNVFEQRYIDMIDAALAGNRLIGMVQPSPDRNAGNPNRPVLASVGCVGRLTSLQETGDGRYLITLQGITRFAVGDELEAYTKFRQVECDFAAFAHDLTCGQGEEDVDRHGLLKTLRNYLDANNLEADWQSVSEAETEVLVNALCMMCPYGPQEKQALLEARDLRTRAETLIAITEMDLANTQNEGGSTLQ
ncbi:MAG: LON peptidase substrate-binding domain-containing protein [Roseibium sp.]|uniref:LON peptidase substrate-binding domain-containing protein n=1 Tax=Roseibium sp. TaxID=1936156 RepID=UPI001B2CC7C3|nr:LON peptidase substrate-binding domain-containing protein [Roseibium sp.]MBO6508303.1 LON peptidase substrate-binding domain-containing protein [Roseibium sp.]MBO6892163.1 LON peptidase substrate-binding domain-containing protein [Roseibium sp.]MBO6932902.1 LON peptidase substrate-binding domain-containing protein [Roseibium sp.]